MHFEILVEDQSGAKALEILVPKIIGTHHTYKITDYKGIGHIPKNLKSRTDANKRILLDQLPRLLRGYGRAFANYPYDYLTAVIFVCDLDDRCLKVFRQELDQILDACDPKPETRFCIAVEEGEAWFLGDIQAIKAAYPKAKDSILNAYEFDSICGTWELLANAIYPGGAKKLSEKGWVVVGAEKFTWSEKIAPLMDIDNNESPSFRYLKAKLQELAAIKIHP